MSVSSAQGMCCLRGFTPLSADVVTALVQDREALTAGPSQIAAPGSFCPCSVSPAHHLRAVSVLSWFSREQLVAYMEILSENIFSGSNHNPRVGDY